MANREFVRCCDCDKLQPVTSFEDAPPTERLSPAADEEWRAFAERHAGHAQEPLRLTGATFGPFSHDHSRPVYLEATNGRGRYLLSRSRQRADEPFVYHVVAASAGAAAR